MSSDGNFIARWSRSEAEARRTARRWTPSLERPTRSNAALRTPRRPLLHRTRSARDQRTLRSIRPACLRSSPSAPDSDIRAFLEKGVPVALTKAALRRAWTADPAIRDFMRIAENQWDFTDPTSIPGFGNAQGR